MIGGDLPIIPLVGVSSVAQLDELMDALDLTLSVDQRTALDEAGQPLSRRAQARWRRSI